MDTVNFEGLLHLKVDELMLRKNLPEQIKRGVKIGGIALDFPESKRKTRRCARIEARRKIFALMHAYRYERVKLPDRQDIHNSIRRKIHTMVRVYASFFERN